MPRLRIHDTYLRQDRAVSTLSGGETFQLSLSLALGLGEAITAAQGGVQLDTVFIDEGFGTLDAEALDGALTVLTELRDSGRIVGVISHVEELHQRVGVTLQVVKGPDGRSQLLSRIP
jgi:exonuclease SbcC